MRRLPTRALALSLLPIALALSCGERQSPGNAGELDTSVFGPAIRRQVDEALSRAGAAPGDADAQGDLGRVLHAYHLFDEAAEAYGRAAALAPGVFRWAYLRGRALAAAGHRDEALASLHDALSLRADYPPLHVAIGELLLEAVDPSAARGYFETGVRLDPASVPAHYGLAKTLRALGERRAAAAAFETTLELAPDFGAGHYALGILYRDLGDAERASRHLALAEEHRQQQTPSRDPLMASVGELAGGAAGLTKAALRLDAQGRTEEAIAKLLEAVEADAAFVPARVNLIQLYSDIGRFREAEEHYRAAIAASPNAQRARFNYARSLVQQRRIDEAVAELEAVIEINPNLADAQVLLGSALEDRGQSEAAARHYRLALASKPAHPQANLMLALHALRAGDLEAAAPYAERLLDAESESLPILVYRLGASYEQAGHPREARRYLDRARSLALEAGRQRLVAEIDRRLEAPR